MYIAQIRIPRLQQNKATTTIEYQIQGPSSEHDMMAAQMTNGSRWNWIRSKSITDYFDAFGGAVVVVATLYYLKFFSLTKFRESFEGFLIPQFGIMQGCTSGLDNFENPVTSHSRQNLVVLKKISIVLRKVCCTPNIKLGYGARRLAERQTRRCHLQWQPGRKRNFPLVQIV